MSVSKIETVNMKIHLLSDLHIEICGFYSIEDTGADVIVLAGDIHTGINGISWAIEEARRLKTPIIYVAGNHEYYKNEYYSTLQNMRSKAFNSDLVHFLENDEIEIDGVRFLGTTLWTDYQVSDETQELCMLMSGNLINDHRLIRMNDELFSTKHALKLHQESLKWLYKNIVSPFSGPTVVITHHGPSKHSAHPDYGLNVLSGAFISNLDTLVREVDLWLYGHTHSSIDTKIGNCRLVSNQRGYPREDMPGGFDRSKVIEV